MSDDLKLSGSLDALSLPGLLQLLGAEGRAGRLDVAAEPSAGSLWLESGHLVHATAEAGGVTTRGALALDLLLGLTEGTFVFAPGETAPERTLDGPTEQLLMEAAVRKDHARRGDPLAVAPSSVPSFAPVPAGGSTPRFTTMQWRVLAAIDGHKSVGEVAAEVELPVEALSALLAGLEAAGVIQIT